MPLAREILSPHAPCLDLWDVVENSGLDRWQGRGLTGRTGEDESCTGLVGSLDESDRELRPERGHSPAPCLTARGIPKAE